MDLTPGPAVYEAARNAMQQREAIPGRPECGPYPATFDELAESIVDAIWPLAVRAGREDAAKAIENADTSGWPGGRGSDVDGCQERAAAVARGGHTTERGSGE